ncbi:putative transcriptional regulator, GntR family [Thermovirga lienii DSM 17291]|uniref:Putative transcriptional regulator, GntR family n=1 Tax=Thermovirga lienii (strain ATCC BAA-1197 / DSM 17291 / Cas60314) TaxID=580340 RepID=G7V9J6_THELD|nr:PLP-dependent aminotransferase family protein [Thermovirga lienii]AER66546.1 putative transcriptional regulator, GntR family [Thermovirga lienii DSM 17291]
MSNFLESLYSQATFNLKPSPIREMLHLIRRPGMISFAGGMPDPEIFPVEQFKEAAGILDREGKDVLQYGTTEGYLPLKEFLAEWTAPKMGRKLATDEILITTGSTQIVDLLSWVLIDKGDWVICEEPTFLGATLTMRNHGASFLTVPCDENGMKVDMIPEMVEKARKEGKKVKFIYTIVNFHNPLGCDLSLERRKKLIEIAEKYNLLILEDDPYGYVRFDGEEIPSIFSMDTSGRVVFACSFSKILAPGTRVAWCAGNKEVIRKMTVFKQGVDVCTSVVAQAMVYEYCRLGHLDSFLPKIIDHYRKKRDAMEEAFRKYLPQGEVKWLTPRGGFFYWLETPKVKAKDLFEKAVEKKVAFVLGEPFFPNGGGEHNFRMCFTFASKEQTEEGISRLGEALRELL